MLVGGLSVIFICLIGRYSKNRNQEILKSTLFVLAIKMAVSPHSPLAAYLAVAMQAGFGILFFSTLKEYKSASICTAIASMISSAVQEILVLTILFGVQFWTAIDRFSEKILLKLSGWSEILNVSLSEWLIGLYLLCYLIGGIFIGWIAASLPEQIVKRSTEFDIIIQHFDYSSDHKNDPQSKVQSYRLWLIIFAFITLAIGLQWIFISRESALTQFTKTIALLLGWIFVLQPIMRWLLQKKLAATQRSLTSEINQVQYLIPRMLAFAKFAWKEHKGNSQKGWLNFISLYVYYAIYKT